MVRTVEIPEGVARELKSVGWVLALTGQYPNLAEWLAEQDRDAAAKSVS